VKTHSSNLLRSLALSLLVLPTISFQLSTRAQGTSFTYQGRLIDAGVPANAGYDMRFTLYDQLGGASSPQFVPNVGVCNGLFTVTIDFGNLFNGDDRTLEIAARPANGGAYVTLSPRQPLTPAPHAIFANTSSNLSGTLSAGQLTGTIANGALPSSPNFSGTVTATAFTGSGANLTSLNAGSISGGTLADARLSSNVALRVGGNIFTNAQAFNGSISLNSSGGFDQSSIGNFYIDAPFVVGGRFAVLENGNIGIGVSNPLQKLQVNGVASVSGLTVNGPATVTGAVNLPTAATINAGADTILHSDANQNFFAGAGAGKNATAALNNTAVGYQAFYQSANGQFNTAVGDLSLHSTTAGIFNTAHGALALYSNTTGGNNTASGFEALFSNISASNNTAVGDQALYSNTIGGQNTANGYQALYANTSGFYNTANGYQALFLNTDANWNTAYGYQSLYSNRNGQDNTASGYQALYSNINGGDNLADGWQALYSNTTGNNNIAIGDFAGGNITTGTGNIEIGTDGNVNESYVIRIGRQGIQDSAFIGGIYGTTLASGVPVYVSSDGQLGTFTSSARYKQNIQNMSDTSDVLLALHPVTFQYKPEIDPQGTPQFGLIAEQVEKVDPELVIHDQEHGIYTVRYEAVNAMLLNEFLKQHHKIEAQHRKMEEQNSEIQYLKQQNESLARRLDELAAAVRSLADEK